MFNFKKNKSILGRSLLIGGLIFYAATPFAEDAATNIGTEQSQAQTQAQWAEDNRVSIVQHVLNTVQAEAEAKGYEGWREELGAFLNEIPGDQLLQAYHADTFAEVVAAIRGADPIKPQAYSGSSEELSSNKLLGDTLRDLVFTPLTPCRIVDTRVEGGKFAASQTRQYSVNGMISGQGGQANCGVPFGTNEPPAVVLNITSSGGEGNGFLTVWEVGEQRPLASLLNFQTSDVANASIVPTGLGQIMEIQVYSSARTHVIIDVIGYLRKPRQTPLEFSRVTGGTPIGGLATVSAFSPSCPSGTEWVSGGFGSPTPQVLSWGIQRDGNNQRTICRGRNFINAPVVIVCHAYCVAVPGH